MPVIRATSITSNSGDLPTDLSDTSEVEVDRNNYDSGQCTNPHDGRKLMDADVNINIDRLFTMIFTDSKFFADISVVRKSTDVVQAAWRRDQETGLKSRKISFTLALGQTIGPKSTPVTETQVMLPCSKAGKLYSIEVSSKNEGVPYADSFSVGVHYCLRKISDTVTNFQMIGTVTYNKSVFGFIKTLIERNSFQALEEFADLLLKYIQIEIDGGDDLPKKKSKQRRRHQNPSSQMNENISSDSSNSSSTCLAAFVIFSICLLITFNVFLYWRLWKLEDGSQGINDHGFVYNLKHGKIPSPEIVNEWIKSLNTHSDFRVEELIRLKKTVDDTIGLLKRTESTLVILENAVKQTNGDPLSRMDL